MPKGKKGNETEYRFLFINSMVGYPMNMYKVIKLNEMSAWSRNVCEKCPLFLQNRNDFKRIWNPLT